MWLIDEATSEQNCFYTEVIIHFKVKLSLPTMFLMFFMWIYYEVDKTTLRKMYGISYYKVTNI